MVLAEMEDDAHVLDGVAGEHAFGEGLAHALLDGRDVLVRDRAADDGVHELEPRAALARLHLEPDLAELAVPAALFLMAVIGRRRDRDGFLVRDARRLGRDADAEPAAEPVEQHVEVEPAHAGDDQFAGALVAMDPQRGILVGELLDGAGDLLLVAARLRFHRQRDHRGRERDLRQFEGRVRRAERVGDLDILDLGDGEDIARDALRDRLGLSAEHAEELRHALAVARARDHGVGVMRKRALENPEVGQLADERVGDRLEDLRDQRRGRVRAQLDFLVLLRVLRDDLALLHRRRQVRGDEVHHFLDAQAALPRDVEDRDERALQDGFAERADQFVRRELLVIQEALHQRLVGLDDLVHQRAGGRGHVAQDAFGRLRGRLQHVHDAFESRADADGQVVRHAFRAERFLDPGHDAGVVHDVVAIHLAHEDDAGETAFLRRGVHAAGVEFDAVRGGDVEERDVRGLQSAERGADEIRVAGRVNEVDLDVLPAAVASAMKTLLWRSFSSSSKSKIEFFSATLPARVTSPALKSIWSRSVVLPLPAWPTATTFRMSLLAYSAMSVAHFPVCHGDSRRGKRGASSRRLPQSQRMRQVQRLENWKLRRAALRPYFFRSFMRLSRVSRPLSRRAASVSALMRRSARATPSMIASAWPLNPPPETSATTSNLPSVFVTFSGARTEARWRSTGKNCSISRELILTTPVPRCSQTRATELLRRPVANTVPSSTMTSPSVPVVRARRFRAAAFPRDIAPRAGGPVPRKSSAV